MSVPKKMRFEVFKRDGFKCTYCGRTPPEAVLQADHILAESKGGVTELLNLTTSCRDCNIGKSNHDLEEVSVPFGVMEIMEASPMKALLLALFLQLPGLENALVAQQPVCVQVGITFGCPTPESHPFCSTFDGLRKNVIPVLQNVKMGFRQIHPQIGFSRNVVGAFSDFAYPDHAQHALLYAGQLFGLLLALFLFISKPIDYGIRLFHQCLKARILRLKIVKLRAMHRLHIFSLALKHRLNVGYLLLKRRYLRFRLRKSLATLQGLSERKPIRFVFHLRKIRVPFGLYHPARHPLSKAAESNLNL